MARARHAGTAGSISVDEFDPARQGRSAEDVFEEMTRLLPGVAAREQAAVTHGDWCLPNVLLDPRP